MTKEDLEIIESKLAIVETHEDGYDLLWAIPELIDEVRRLRKQITSAPAVMGYLDGVTWHDKKLQEMADDYTHQAKLVDIEEIQRDVHT